MTVRRADEFPGREMEEPNNRFEPLFSHDAAEAAETTWRVMAEIETSRGTLYIKIPMFNDNVQKLIANCQHRYELEKQRGGHPDAPASQPM